MNKEGKEKKLNISISVHQNILFLVEKYCKDNNFKKSRFIENILKEYFKKQIIMND